MIQATVASYVFIDRLESAAGAMCKRYVVTQGLSCVTSAPVLLAGSPPQRRPHPFH